MTSLSQKIHAKKWIYLENDGVDTCFQKLSVVSFIALKLDI